MKKATTAELKEKTALLRRVTELEETNVAMELRAAEHAMEVATLKRQVVNLMRDRDDQDERIGWVRSLVDGRQTRPAALHDSKAGRKL